MPSKIKQPSTASIRKKAAKTPAESKPRASRPKSGPAESAPPTETRRVTGRVEPSAQHGQTIGVPTSPQERQRMIEEAAYYRHVNGGGGGTAVDDWLAAEADVNRSLQARRRIE